MNYTRILLLALGLLALPLSPARGEAQVETFNLGDITIIALADAPGAHDIALFHGAAPELIKALAPSGKVASGINTFLIQSDGQNILVDTGLGIAAGGSLLESLALLGLTPTDIDIILITHMHFDHTGGLVADNQAVFPKAVLKIGNLEQSFWLAPDAVDPTNSPFVDFGPAKSAADIYKDRLEGFEFNEQVGPGITAQEALGHTPGHTMFLVQSGEQQLLIWGDLIHGMALQMPHPEIYPDYDYDPVTAIATRKAVLERVSESNTPVAGMHIPFPGVGYVNKAEQGYSFTPGLN